MHDVLLSSAAERDLKKLPAAAFARITAAIKDLGREPRPPGCRKLAATQQDYRIRVGDYRVIYEVDDANQTVRVMRVRHRREAYR